ncbi:MAG: hypothetical protein ACW97X_08750 [Candidatus Hodarchaeales archaeon]|jgi:hypothetical protein
MVSLWTVDPGNGMIEFYANITDWPDNNTASTLFYTTNYPLNWVNSSMEKVSENIFLIAIPFSFQLQNIWYYVNASDSENNIAQTSQNSLSLIDEVAPIIQMTFFNSTIEDGEIILLTSAIDPFGEFLFVNNTFYANVTYQSTTTTYEMSYDSFYNYKLILNYPYQTYITVTIYVEDELGNLGILTKTLHVDDITPPQILRYDETDHQNGTVTVWAEVYENPNGSGLSDDNSSVNIEYIYSNEIRLGIMKWNGTKNFFSFSIHGFIPGNSFSYEITASDKNNNKNTTIPEIFTVADTIYPEINDHDVSQERINHTHIKLFFWVNATDEFGEVESVTIFIQYNISSVSFVKELILENEGSDIWYTDYILICNITFNHSITIEDKFSNYDAVNNPLVKTLVFLRTEILDFDVNFPSNQDGIIIFWILINDTFNDDNISLTLYNQISGELIMNEVLMFPANSTGTMVYYFYNTSIDYGTKIRYIMNVINPGTIQGYYSINSVENTTEMVDIWEPIIVDKGSKQISNSIYFWANISDWGSNISHVELYLELDSEGTSGGIGSTYNNYYMQDNGSYWELYVNITEEGSYNWYIVVYDIDGNNNWDTAESNTTQGSIYLPGGNQGLDPIVILIAIIGTIFIFGSVLMLTRSFQRKTKTKHRREKSFKEKLSIIPNIYSLVVTTGVGVPILDVSNVLYHKESELNGALSGLSVGIDSFLESFQSDFIGQIQEESILTDDNSSQTRLSLIEKEKIQILIGASPSYRMFLFLKEKPSNFIRNESGRPRNR